MRRTLALTAVVAVLSGCGSPPPPPPPLSPLPPPPRPAPPPPSDQCRAGEHQHLVGRPRTDIPVPVNPSDQRVACTTCPVTQDFRADRLNFFFDADTGVIREIRCG